MQIDEKLLRQHWPALAVQIVRNHGLCQVTDGSALTHSENVAAEAAYALGVALGYSLRIDQGSVAAISASIPGWRADACGELNWPRITSTQPPGAGSRR